MTGFATSLQSVVVRRPRATALLLVVVAAAALLARLGTPDRIYFDETYYVDDALGYLATGVEPSFAVHPTLGKWLIAAGIAAAGDTPFGWRVAGAVAGVVTVLLTHLLARRLLAGRRWGPLLAVVAPLLLLTDGLFLAQARISMLDVFLVLFGVAAMLLLVVDGDRRRAGTVRRGRPSLRWLVGVALGLACAVKWSGLLVLGAAGLLTIGWEVAAARRAVLGAGRRLPRQRVVLAAELLRRGAAVVGSLVLVPLVVYSLTWLPWLASYEHTWAADCDDEAPIEECPAATASVTERVDGLLRYHEAGIDFHLGLESEHSYRSDPLGWVVLARPVVYYWETCSEDRANGVLVEDEDTGEMVPPEPCEVPVGDAGEIIAMGNPVLWWGFLALVPLLVGGAVRRDRGSTVVLVTWLSLWVPWLFVSRLAFLFYMAPAVPFLAIGTVVAIDRLDVRHRVLGAHVGAVAGALGGLASGWAVQVLGLAVEGWRPRLVAMVTGIAVGTLLGASIDVGAERAARRARRRAADGTNGPGGVATDGDGRSQAGCDAGPGDRPVAVGAVAPGGASPRAALAAATLTATTAVVGERRAARPARANAPTARHPAPAPSWLVPFLALLVLGAAVAMFTFFGPVWYGVPLDREVLRWRWWFDSWI